MYLRHQAYTLYYRHVCILVFLHVFAYSMLLRCIFKFKRLACGSDDVTQYNTLDQTDGSQTFMNLGLLQKTLANRGTWVMQYQGKATQ